MSEAESFSGPVVESVDELRVGDGVYSEASCSPYWVEEITPSRIVLRDRKDTRRTWVRETFEASLAAHTWLRQFRSIRGSGSTASNSPAD